MSEPTVILAILSVLGHCLVIFWPRKPLTVSLDANGLPILWRNNDAKHEDVACVWRDVAEEPVAVAEDDARRQRHA